MNCDKKASVIENIQFDVGVNPMATLSSAIENMRSMKLDNIFNFDSYYGQINDYYENLDELCYEALINYPEDEIFFVSIRNSINNIRLYFLNKVAKLLEVESVDYRIWKPCLDKAIINSVDYIMSSIYSLVSISNDMKTCLEKGYIIGLITLKYLFFSEFNDMIRYIKIKLHKELEDLGINIYNL